MARVGVTKKKKSPRATELSQLKKELSASPNSLSLAIASSPKLSSSRRQRVTFLGLLVGHRLIYRRYLIRSRGILLSSVALSSVLSTGLMAS
jgi:hypothetical protein